MLSLEPNQHGGFDFLHNVSAQAFGPGGRTISAHFEKHAEYFGPSEKPFMINLMVDDLDAMIVRLTDKGVPLAGDPETYDYGKFAWVMDPNGIKIELWQPLADPTI